MANPKKIKHKPKMSPAAVFRDGPITAPNLTIRDEKQVPKTADRLSDGRPSWRFNRMDFDARWSWKGLNDENELKALIKKLGDKESASFDDLRRAGCHEVSMSKMAPGAQRRLLELKLGEDETYYSVRLDGKTRIWCIRIGRVLHLLWYDPNHEICPCPKKHT